MSTISVPGKQSVAAPASKSFTRYITNIIQGSFQYGDGQSITNNSIIISTLVVIFIIGISLLYSKDNATKSRRLTSSVILGLGGTLLYCFILMVTIAYRSKMMNTVQLTINIFVCLVYTYFYAVYCIFPLIVYVDRDEDIYDDIKEEESGHNYSKVVDTIALVTNILIICMMIYIIYLLFWYRDSILLKRQLLPIAVIFGVTVGKSIKEIINKIIRK